ncbi:MAG: hypothetical protein ACYSW8_31310 [Planctomycetota bacterium]|jgi:hypothetical protein
MNDNEAIERFIRAVELLASATDRQANCAEQQLKLQAEMVNNQRKMAEGTAALEKQLTGKRR